MIGEFVLNTKERVLVEASPVDPIWGVGLPINNPKTQNVNTWGGENLLDFALMEARDLLRESGFPNTCTDKLNLSNMKLGYMIIQTLNEK